MVRKVLYILIALVPGAAPPAATQVPPPLDRPGLLRYVGQVLDLNAGLAAASSDVRAAMERIAPAGALPDPIVTLGMMSVPVPSFDFEREAMTQLPLGVQQAFPFPGKQGARTEVARNDSAVAAAGVELATNILAAEAAAAFFELAYARSTVEVWQRRLELANRAVETAMARYETGRATQTDLLRAELKRARLIEEGRQFSADVEGALARIDALRGGPGDTVDVPELTGPDSAAIFAALRDALLAPERLARTLRAQNRALAQVAARVERARASARLFAIAARPDFVLGVQSGVRLGGREPFLTAVIGLSVPLWAGRKQSPAARAAALDVRSMEQRYEDLRLMLEGELLAQIARLDALRERIAELREQVLPLAAAASSSALRSYGVGALELTAVLDAQDDLFEVRLGMARLVADYGAQRAALAALLGEEWYR